MHFHNILHMDEHDVVRLGVRSLLQQVIPVVTIRSVRNHANLNSELQLSIPDLIILECGESLRNCVTLVGEILFGYPQIRILLFTRHTNALFLSQLVGAGAHGIVLKSEDHYQFETALHALSKGNTYYSPAVVAKLASFKMKSKLPDTSCR